MIHTRHCVARMLKVETWVRLGHQPFLPPPPTLRRCGVFCPNCGTQNPDAAQSCSKCNFHLKSVAAPKFKGTMLMMNQASVPQPGTAKPGAAAPKPGAPAPAAA